MNIYTEQLTYNKTDSKLNVINITSDVNTVINKSGVADGLCNISIIGSTASITTIEYENGLIQDIENTFERLIPSNIEYEHNNRWGDGNGYSHIRSSLLKTSMTFQIENGQLLLGTWQQIVFLDFDNKPRTRKLSIKVLGE